MLPEFDLHQPANLDEALEILVATPEALPLAGGTCLLVDLRKRRCTVDTLIDLSRVAELRAIRIEESELVVGAMARIAEILDSEEVARYAPILRKACRSFAAPLVRNRATVGGNLAYASPAADMAGPLLVLDAVVELRSTIGLRRLPLAEFFLGPGKTVRQANELLTSIRISIADERPWAYEKLGLRKADAITVVSASVARMPSDGSARIALGAVAPTPLRVRRAEEELGIGTWSADAIANAARLAADEARPIDDVRGSGTYRKREVDVLVRRSLERVAEGGEADGA